MGLIHNEKVYGLKIRESADDGSDFGTPDADYRFLYVGEDGDLHLKDASDVVTDFPAGGGSGTLSGVRVTRNAALNVGTSEAAIAWDNQVTDTDDYWEGVTNPSRITIPSNGSYHIGATLEFPSTTGDWVQGYLRLDGTTSIQFDIYFQATTTTKSLQWSQFITLTASQYVEVYAQAQATTAITPGATCNFWAYKVG